MLLVTINPGPPFPITLEHLKAIEQAAYPAAFWAMDEAQTWRDVAEYAEVDIGSLVVFSNGSTWYAIFALHGDHAEGVDIAKVPGSSTIDWLPIFDTLRAEGIRTIEAETRRASHRKLQRERRRLGVEFLADRPYRDFRGERMHEVILQLV